MARVISEEDALTGVVDALEEAYGLGRDRPRDHHEQPCGGSAPKLPGRPGSSTGSAGLRRSPQRGSRTEVCALSHSDTLSWGPRDSALNNEDIVQGSEDAGAPAMAEASRSNVPHGNSNTLIAAQTMTDVAVSDPRNPGVVCGRGRPAAEGCLAAPRSSVGSSRRSRLPKYEGMNVRRSGVKRRRGSRREGSRRWT